MADHPGLLAGVQTLSGQWPAFFQGDLAAARLQAHLPQWTETIWAAVNPEAPDQVLGRAIAVPLRLHAANRFRRPDGGWDTLVGWALEDLAAGTLPDTLVGLDITVEDHAPHGVASALILALRTRASELGCREVLIPLRPAAPASRPDLTFTEYLRATQPDQRPVDPWLRLHLDLGGRVEGVARRSMTVVAELEQWRKWTGATLQSNGPTWVPGGIVPVQVNQASGLGRYVEPNIYIVHSPPTRSPSPAGSTKTGLPDVIELTGLVAEGLRKTARLAGRPVWHPTGALAISCHSGWPGPFHRAAVVLDDTRNPTETLASLGRRLDPGGRWILWLRPDQAALQSVAERGGFRPLPAQGTPDWIRPLDRPTSGPVEPIEPDRGSSPDLRWVPVDRESWTRFVELVVTAFRDEATPEAALREQFGPEPPAPEDGIQALFAEVEGQPAAAAWVRLHGHLAVVEQVAVAPAFRRRGLGRRITRRALDLASQLGAEWAVVQPTTAGEPVYRALGFFPAGSWQWWISPKSAPELRVLGPGWPRGALPEVNGVDEFVRLHAHHQPDRLALESSTVRLTYRQLEDQIERVSHALVRAAIGAGDRVAVLDAEGIEPVVAFLGVLRSGAAAIALDPDEPAPRRAIRLRTVRALVAGVENARALLETHPHVGMLVIDPADLRSPTLPPPPVPAPAPARDPEAIAYVAFTSGSSGTPKGVAISHRALLAHAAGMVGCFKLHGDDRVLQLTSLTFDVAFEEIVPTLAAGATVVRAPRRARFSLADLEALMSELGPTVINLPSPLFHTWVDQCRVLARPPRLGARIRLLVVGSDRTEPAAIRSWQTMVRPPHRIVHAYGTTETTITSLAYEIPWPLPETVNDLPLGFPLAHARVELRTRDDDGRPTSTSPERRELVVRGTALATGYLLTEANDASPSWVEHTFREGWYATGDAVRLNTAGELCFAGRLDAQIKIRGIRLEPSEIEAALRALPGIRDAVVLPIPVRPGSVDLHGWVASDDLLNPAELRASLAQRLPEAFVPTSLAVLRELPRTAGGKIDRTALRTLAFTSSATVPPPTPNRSPIELLVEELWAEVLGSRALPSGADLLKSGADSLSILELAVRLEAALGTPVGAARVLEAGTKEGLQALAQSLLDSTWQRSPLLALHPSGIRPPLFLATTDERTLFGLRRLSEVLGQEQPLYAMPLLLETQPDSGAERVSTYATRLVDAARAIQPRGPLRLGGVSLGTLVALQSAHLLQDRGEVAHLLLVDGVCHAGLPWSERSRLIMEAPLLWLLERALGPRLPENVALKLRQLRRWLRRDTLEDDRARHEVRLLAIEHRDRPTPLTGDANLIVSAEEVRLSSNSSLGWRRMVQGSLTVDRVPGGHFDLFQSQLPATAAAISRWLQRHSSE
ncbi:MAG: GNAT family N-acetyltransferase [Verrucomicrobia bacterium]|nr:GNAT family N-acetyltransferase [Verrucomicrobiota bacterium]